MTHEILPNSSDGLSERIEKSWSVDAGTTQTTTKTGPATTLSTEYDTMRETGLDNSFIQSISLTTENGRGTYRIHYSGSASDDPDVEINGTQELLAIDVVRPIYVAPYFINTDPVLNYQTIGDVRRAVEKGQRTVTAAWSDKQKILFYHLIMGRTKYYETSYVFRKTYRTSSGQQVRRTVNNVNTVQALPNLSNTMRNFINALPSGEWLQRPTQVRYLGRDGWDVAEEFLWSPQWSVVYGGTFTGAP